MSMVQAKPRPQVPLVRALAGLDEAERLALSAALGTFKIRTHIATVSPGFARALITSHRRSIAKETTP